MAVPLGADDMLVQNRLDSRVSLMDNETCRKQWRAIASVVETFQLRQTA